MKAPFIPNLSADNFDEQHANLERSMNESEQHDIDGKKDLLRRDSIQNLFKGYYFDHTRQELKDKKEAAKTEKTANLANKSTQKSTTKSPQRNSSRGGLGRLE